MYPSVRFVLTPGHKTIPQLRAYGMAATDADVVALTEDHCIVASNWVSQLLSAFEQGTEVVGGAMDNAQRRRAIDWAAYFAEYGFFAENRDLQALRAPLTAANVAYRRAVVNEVIKWAKQGEWENVIHARLLEQGRSFQFLKTATVYQNKNYRFWDFCRDRFVHGRDYARRRLLDERSRRCTYFVGSFVLPAVLTLRVSQIAAGHHPRPFLRALPFTFAFLTAWSIGETVGYCYGPAGPCTNRT